jgi:hypothetical protein
MVASLSVPVSSGRLGRLEPLPEQPPQLATASPVNPATVARKTICIADKALAAVGDAQAGIVPRFEALVTRTGRENKAANATLR